MSKNKEGTEDAWTPDYILQKLALKNGIQKEDHGWTHFCQQMFAIGKSEPECSDWQRVKIIAAKLVERLGPSYLPIYERAKRELRKSEKRNQSLIEVSKLLARSERLKRDFIQP